MNVAIQSYRKESILIKDAIKQFCSKNDSLYLLQKNLPDERLQNGLAIDRNNVYFDLRTFDLSLQIIEQLNLRNDTLENGRDFFIKKFKQTQAACKVYENTTTFSVTI
ncbi:MAG: hypothetical protein NTX75_12305 [Proteobacteria bacterium]|nr:hypothetical protein [Pseudomonadota bacterium]